MSQPVKVSEELLLAARTASQQMERSMAGQIEFWARLGRAVEPLLTGQQMVALQRAQKAQALAVSVSKVDTDAGRQVLSDYLRHQPFPHYEPCPEKPGFLIRIDEDGTPTQGRFVRRQFVPTE